MFPEPNVLAGFLAGALILNLTPGPDVAFTLASTARGGLRAGLAAAAGIVVGCTIWAAAAALGLASLFAASQEFLTFIRILGGAYLVFLAVQTFRHRRDASESAGARGMMSAFRSGLLTNMLNPKVGLFFVAFLPAFIDPVRDGALQIFALGGLFALTGGMVLALYATIFGRAHNLFGGDARFTARLNVVAAAIFGGLGLHLIFARQN
ncbi:MAG: LysE family translocator [Pseudomonadota bacterium]